MIWDLRTTGQAQASAKPVRICCAIGNPVKRPQTSGTLV